jgi:UDP-N-acetylmuramoyl-L-alanyl-D-glutamate--2,6-diaminopimelate ligase
MTLGELLQGSIAVSDLPEEIAGLPVSGLDFDSRRIQPGPVFFAWRGAKADGNLFASQAIAQGACAIVSEDLPPEGLAETSSVPWIQIDRGRHALALAARQFYPRTHSLQLTGITGTNGKTTTSYLVDSVLRCAGFTTGLVGTIEYHVAGEVRPAINTTPESLELYRLFDDLVQRGGSKAVMEVSSHALAQGRVYGMPFHSAIFTNLTQDHLDFHGDMESYFQAKHQLFRGQGVPAPDHAILNYDDSHGRSIEVAARTRSWWYGRSVGAAIRPDNIQQSFEGLKFDVRFDGGLLKIDSALTGDFNVLNILAACGAGLAYGLEPGVIEQGIANCRAIPGRFERVESSQPFLVIVDYAHSPDALRNVIQVARSLNPKRVLTLFGCGGDRDRSKRPLMGEAAAELSDYVVLTSDNPRSEDPLAIINDALVGLRRFDTPHHIEPDRALAIRHALLRAEAGDIVILAGKGHENYQVLADRTIHFDDREVARQILGGFGA